MNTITNPYIGPRTFQENERDRFFGRKREARDLLALVLSEQLVLFYAQSGAGKSSLVNTCLIPDLRAKGFEVFTGRIAGDASAGIQVENVYVFNLLHSLAPDKITLDSLGKTTISEFFPKLRSDAASAIMPKEEQASRRHALIIDQFEEIFSTHHEAWQKREGFFQQLAQAMEEDPYLWVVLVMREDFIAAMDPYAFLLPGRFRRRYYMQRLERSAALDAIKKPVKDLRPYAEGVAEKLVDDLCSVKVYKPDGTPDLQPGQYVEPVQLQVICYNLWENLPPGGRQITEKDLQDVGDVNTSLGNYYAGRMKAVAEAKNVKERKIREWFTDKLISPGGIRTMVLQEPGKKSSGLENDIIQALPDLIRAEQRGGAIFYELTHDRLVEPIVANNKKWEEEHASPLQRQAALWNDQSRNDSWLLTDQALTEVAQWAKDHVDEITNIEQEFLEAGQTKQQEREEEQQREAQRQILETTQRRLDLTQKLADEQERSARRAKRFNALALGLVIIAVSATVFAIFQLNDANKKSEEAITAQNAAEAAKAEAKDLAKIARSGELSTIALGLSDSQLDLAILLGLEANSLKSHSQTQNALLALLQKSGRYRGTIKADEEFLEIQYAPDGKTFASRDKNGIIFWDANTLKPLIDTPVNGHFAGVTALAISKDGKLMASGALDGTIVIWDAVKRQILSKSFKAHTGRTMSLAFSRDGTTLASTGSDETTIILWDLMTDPENPQPIGEPLSGHNGSIISIAFSPDGKALASGSSDATIILWDVETGQSIGEPLTGHPDPVWSVAFSPDGKTLASGSYDDTVILWDVNDLENPEQKGEPLAGHPIDIEVIAISPDGKTLASGDDAGNIILWDLQTGESTGEPLNGMTSWVISLAFSPDSNTLAAGSLDQSVILWDVKNQTQIGKTLLDHDASVWGVAFSPDGETLVSASEDSTILFWDISEVNNPQIIGKPLQGHIGQLTGMQFSPDGSLVSSYGEDATILLDVKTQKQVGVGDILTSPDGSILVFQALDKATGESSIHVRDAGTGEAIGAALSGQNPIFSPDSKKLVFQTYDTEGQSVFQLFDITGKKIAGFAESGDAVDFSPDSQFLVLRKTDPDTGQASVNLWYIPTAKKLAEDIEGSDPIVISSNSELLIYQTFESFTGEINLWDIPKGIKLKRIPGRISVVSQDHKILAFETYDASTQTSSINLLDTNTGASLIRPIKGGTPLALSADGKILLYQRSDGSINALDTQTETPIGGPIIGDLTQISSAGQFLVSAGQILVYEISSYNSTTGEYESSLVLINRSRSTQIGQTIKGHFVDLLQEGKFLEYETPEGTKKLLDTSQSVNIPFEGTYLDTSSDGKTLVYRIFENNSNNLKVLDLTNNKNHGEPVKEDYGTYFAIGPDGKTLVTRNENNALIFWDITKTWPLGDPVTENTSEVSSAALSPDGKALAFTDASGITLQDTTSGEMIRTLFNEHTGRVTNVILSPDKHTLLSIGEDNKTIAWDLSTFRSVSDPLPGTNASFSPDSELVAIGDGSTNTITVWNVVTRRAIGDVFTGTNFTFGPDSKTLATVDANNNSITLWDPTTQQIIGGPFTGQSVTFSPDSETLAMNDGYSNTTVLFDLIARQIIGESIQGNILTSLETNDIFVVVDTFENNTTVWEWKTRKPVAESIDGSSSYFTGIGYTILVVQNGVRNETTLWNPVTQRQIGRTLAGFYSPSFSPDGTLMSTADSDNNSTLIIDLKTGKQVGKAIPGYYNPTFCADNKTVAWFDKKTVIVWDLEMGQSVNELKLDQQAQSADEIELNQQESADSGLVITFNPSCNIVALANHSKNKTTLWDWTKKDSIREREGSYAIFSPDSSTVVIVDYSKNVTTFWDVLNARKSREVDGISININPENSNIAAIQNNNVNPVSTTIWNLNTHAQIGGDLGTSYYPIFTVDGTLITYSNKGVAFWDVDKNEMVGSPLKGHSSLITNMLVSPNGNVLASRAADGIMLTDLETQSSTHLETGDYANQLAQIAFNPEGTRLTALGNDGTILIWDIASSPLALRDILETPYKDFVNRGVYRPTLSPDGKYLLYESDSKLNIWSIDEKKPVGDPTEIKTCCQGVITFSPDEKFMFYNDGGTIYQWEQWNNPEADSKPIELLSTGQNYVSSLGLVMGGTAPKYLITSSPSTDEVGNPITAISQIWDWAGNSRIGDPISGNYRVLGSSAQTGVLIYLDNDGRLIQFDVNPTAWPALLCQRAGRNFTSAEWEQYFSEDYRVTCPQWPAASEVVSGASP